MLVLLEGKKLLKQEQSEGAEGEQGVSSYVTWKCTNNNVVNKLDVIKLSRVDSLQYSRGRSGMYRSEPVSAIGSRKYWFGGDLYESVDSIYAEIRSSYHYIFGKIRRKENS